MKKKSRNYPSLSLLIFTAIILAVATPLIGAERFPSPDFESGYKLPPSEKDTLVPAVMIYVDMGMFFLLLTAAAWSVLGRSRRGIYMITLFSIAYFGFYRSGCICAVGAVQNVVLSIFDRGYVIPLKALVFVSLPLLFTLFFGRVFCSSVCPLGALQEVVILKPLRLPAAVKWFLGLIPIIILGLTVLMVSTKSGFILCRLDPFVSIFRFGGPWQVLIPGLVFLAAGTVIGRPYCRFFCPYGVVLGIFSCFSRNHISICPGECIQCRLCENSCPVDAILIPCLEKGLEKKRDRVRRLGWILVASPMIIAVFGFSFERFGDHASVLNPTVRLAVRIAAEESGKFKQRSIDSEAFRRGSIKISELMSSAVQVKRKFTRGCLLFGIFLGLVIVVKLINLNLANRHREYVTDRFHCLSCGRCMEFCPVKEKK